MGHKFPRGFTAAEKTELWDRWKCGESLKAIGRAFGKQSLSIYFLVAPHVGLVLPSGVAPGWRPGILVRKRRSVAITAAIAAHFPAHRRG